MGYVEQLYTFVDTHRRNEHGMPVLYVSYLGLVREAADSILHPDAKWQDCYGYFPWEDLRTDGGQRDAVVSRLRIWQTRRTRRKCAKSGSSAFICAGGSSRKTGRKNTFCNAMKCCMKAA